MIFAVSWPVVAKRSYEPKAFPGNDLGRQSECLGRLVDVRVAPYRCACSGGSGST
jgi:hypothetical protein